FVIVGGGATGTELAGALADMINLTMTREYTDLAVKRAQVILVEHGPTLLAPFSPEAHDYAARVLQRKGVRLRLGQAVTGIAADHVQLSDGTSIPTRTVAWACGLMAAPLANNAGLPRGRGGRIEVQPDLSVEGFPRVYALGDFANVPGADGAPLPQLGSVAQQSGVWTGKKILAEIAGKPRTAFHYHDKGIMAMIGRDAAVAEVGRKRHELHGPIAFAAWLGVHAMLMTGVRERIEAFVDWAWTYFSKTRQVPVLDRSDAGRIHWGEHEKGNGTKEAALRFRRGKAPQAPARTAGWQGHRARVGGARRQRRDRPRVSVDADETELRAAGLRAICSTMARPRPTREDEPAQAAGDFAAVLRGMAHRLQLPALEARHSTVWVLGLFALVN